MSAVDLIVVLVIAGLVSLAVYKIVRDKKRGVKCSGCGGCSECPVCNDNPDNNNPQQ